MPTTTPDTTPRTGERASLLFVLLAGVLLAAPAGAVNLSLQSSRTDAGTVKLCVGLESGGEKVAGTQNDLIWDAGCAKLKEGSCAAVPDSKKPLHGNAPPNLPSTFRALVFALDNVDPIRDGGLYCCEFELTGSGDGCCAVRLDRMGASDPVGTALATAGKPPQLCLASGAAPAGGAPAPAAPAAPPVEGGKWLWLVLIGVAVVLVVVLMVRGRKA